MTKIPAVDVKEPQPVELSPFSSSPKLSSGKYSTRTMLLNNHQFPVSPRRMISA